MVTGVPACAYDEIDAIVRADCSLDCPATNAANVTNAWGGDTESTCTTVRACPTGSEPTAPTNAAPCSAGSEPSTDPSCHVSPAGIDPIVSTKVRAELAGAVPTAPTIAPAISFG